MGVLLLYWLQYFISVVHIWYIMAPSCIWTLVIWEMGHWLLYILGDFASFLCVMSLYYGNAFCFTGPSLTLDNLKMVSCMHLVCTANIMLKLSFVFLHPTAKPCVFCWGDGIVMNAVVLFKGIHQSAVDPPHKGPVKWTFGVSNDVCPNKLLNESSNHWWFQMLTHMTPL